MYHGDGDDGGSDDDDGDNDDNNDSDDSDDDGDGDDGVPNAEDEEEIAWQDGAEFAVASDVAWQRYQMSLWHHASLLHHRELFLQLHCRAPSLFHGALTSKYRNICVFY